ncbi:hypothetical protein M408DRAFT_317654 [Serendipita vermifera MAFF 305830]|uniref:RWD domain-containing protein n=1 Tax=Serendipita vermifera MAFF 305830 TaxID=933852 RepID=A0A0C2WD68_SERVB|nr:hypothetical protein M408DRAFT_317654 [Serendipita vermifera MAFF 305830]
MSEEVLIEEFEVLESIYADEMTKVSDRELSIVVEPEEPVSGMRDFKICMNVIYPPEYPDVYPEVSLEAHEEGDEATELTTEETEKLLSGLEEVGNENTGMAMTFTLVTHLREQLTTILQARAEKIQQEEMEKERRAIEEARTKGTPVTQASFLKWRATFAMEEAEKKKREDDEKMKGWSMKEREEARRVTARLTGRQLFERGTQIEDASLFEEGTESVDVTQFEREDREAALQREEEANRVHLSDSD